MGAHSERYVFIAKDKADAIKKAKAFQQAEQHENGHGPYTGHLGTAGVGVQYLNTIYDTPGEAEFFILDKHHKWDLPMLAQCKDGVWILAGWCAS